MARSRRGMSLKAYAAKAAERSCRPWAAATDEACDYEQSEDTVRSVHESTA